MQHIKSIEKSSVNSEDIYNKKNNLVDYLYVFLLVIISSRASFLSEIDNLKIVFFIFTWVFFFIRTQNILGRSWKFIILVIFWISIIYIKFEIPLLSFPHFQTFTGFIVLILTGYFIIVSVANFFSMFIKIVYYLALISLIGFLIQLILPSFYSSINSIITEYFSILNSARSNRMNYTNIIIFTYVDLHGLRNSGFLWEPGAYGSWLNFTLFLHFRMNNFEYDRIANIFIIAILTSLSTTAFIALLLVLLYKYYFQSIKFKKSSTSLFLYSNCYIYFFYKQIFFI